MENKEETKMKWWEYLLASIMIIFTAFEIGLFLLCKLYEVCLKWLHIKRRSQNDWF